jgi:hypothetical protein
VKLAVEEVCEIIEGLSVNPKKKSIEKKTSAKKSSSKKKKSSSPAKADLPKDEPQGSNGSVKKKNENPELPESVDENEVHDFWKAATLEEEISRIDSPDSLSFEQAQKLGFIPKGNDLGK